MMRNNENLGYAIGITDILLFGFVPVFAHFFSKTIDPLLLAGLTTLVGSFPFLVGMTFKKTLSTIYDPKLIKYLLLIAVLTSIGTMLLFVGTKLTSGINTGLLMQVEPLYSLILSAVFLGEIISVSHVLGTFLMIAGAAAIVYKGSLQLNLGDIFILIMPFVFQIAHLTAKKVFKKITDANIVPTSRLFYGGLMLTVIAIIVNPSSLRQLLIWENVRNILLFAFILRSLDMFLWYQAIQKVELSKISALIPLSVGASFIGSVIILKEIPTFQQYAGAGLIIVGLIWLSYLQLHHRKSSVSAE